MIEGIQSQIYDVKEEELLRAIGILKSTGKATNYGVELMSYDTEHYYAVQSFLEDDELCKIWNIIEIAMNREGYDVSNAELSMRLYDSEFTENVEHDYLDSLSEGYDTKVDTLVDSMGVSDKLVSQRHERRDLDAL